MRVTSSGRLALWPRRPSRRLALFVPRPHPPPSLFPAPHAAAARPPCGPSRAAARGPGVVLKLNSDPVTPAFSPGAAQHVGAALARLSHDPPAPLYFCRFSRSPGGAVSVDLGGLGQKGLSPRLASGSAGVPAHWPLAPTRIPSHLWRGKRPPTQPRLRLRRRWSRGWSGEGAGRYWSESKEAGSGPRVPP